MWRPPASRQCRLSDAAEIESRLRAIYFNTIENVMA